MTDPTKTDTETADGQPATSVEDLRALLREAEEALGNSDSGASDDVQDLRERLRDVLADGQSTMKNLSDTFRRQAARADEAVRSKPYQTIGIAAAIGLLAGFLISRGGSRKS
jgi:ElaB/YqjD/DUF883 family membrane-anchored ribosome-binding protein